MLRNIKKLLKNKVGFEGKDAMYDLVIAQYVAIIASNMRVTVSQAGTEPTPCNIYSMIIAPSGIGKNYTIDLVEKTLLDPFYELFRAIEIGEATRKSELFAKNNPDLPDPEAEAYKKYFSFGALPILVDSATPAGLKAFRQQAQLLGLGALGLSIDEIGTSLTKLEDVLSEMLTLHGSGLLKGKLIKGSVDNIRNIDDGTPVPANLLMFGTANIMFDGGNNEAKVKDWFESGYARRLFFTFIKDATPPTQLTPIEIYKQRLNGISLEEARADLSDIIVKENIGKHISMDEEVNIRFIEFELEQQQAVSELADTEALIKLEMSHTTQKVLKLAGAYSFIEGLETVSMECLERAIALCTKSSMAFKEITKQQPPYVRLCEFLSNRDEPIPQYEIKELPFIPESKSKFNEIFELACSFGYENGKILTEYVQGSVSFYRASSLKPSVDDKWIVSHSRQLAEGYLPKELPTDYLCKLLTSGANWCNTHFDDNYRLEENVTGSSNLIVLDIDGGCSLETAQAFLEGFKYILVTTKSHTEENHRFRVVLFLSHKITLTGDAYKRFAMNVKRWLPFNDNATTQRSRKWATYKEGKLISKEGQLLPTMSLIPRSVVNNEREEHIAKLNNIGNLERWFIFTAEDAGRNNTLYKYAKVLEEVGEDFITIKKKVRNLNKGFQEPLSSSELDSTVLTHFNN